MATKHPNNKLYCFGKKTATKSLNIFAASQLSQNPMTKSSNTNFTRSYKYFKTVKNAFYMKDKIHSIAQYVQYNFFLSFSVSPSNLLKESMHTSLERRSSQPSNKPILNIHTRSNYMCISKLNSSIFYLNVSTQVLKIQINARLNYADSFMYNNIGMCNKYVQYKHLTLGKYTQALVLL